MGWLYGYSTRKALIDHLVSGNGVKTLKYCLKGNNLWAVHETDDGKTRYVVLYMLRGRDEFNRRTGKYDAHGWGYKDIDGDSGPNYCNCPLGYLDLLSPARGYGVEWRQRVRDYWTKRGRKLEEGTRIEWFGKFFTVKGKARMGYYVLGDDGHSYRMTTAQISNAKVIEEEEK